MHGGDPALLFTILQQFGVTFSLPPLRSTLLLFFQAWRQQEDVPAGMLKLCGLQVMPQGGDMDLSSRENPSLSGSSPVSCGEPACPAREPQKPQPGEPPKSSFRKNREGLGFEMLLSTFLPEGMRAGLGWAPTRTRPCYQDLVSCKKTRFKFCALFTGPAQLQPRAAPQEG